MDGQPSDKAEWLMNSGVGMEQQEPSYYLNYLVAKTALAAFKGVR